MAERVDLSVIVKLENCLELTADVVQEEIVKTEDGDGNNDSEAHSATISELVIGDCWTTGLMKCHLCDYIPRHNNKTSALQDHLIFKHNFKSNTKRILYECTKCPYTSYRSNYFYQHMYTTHKEIMAEDQLHQCTKCDYKTYFPHRLSIHKNTVYCGKDERRGKILGSSKSTVAVTYSSFRGSPKSATVYKCMECDYSTLLKKCFISHKSRTSPCNKSLYVRKSGVKELKILKCDHCSYETIYSCDLKRHSRRTIFCGDPLSLQDMSTIDATTTTAVATRAETSSESSVAATTSATSTSDVSTVEDPLVAPVTETASRTKHNCHLCRYSCTKGTQLKSHILVKHKIVVSPERLLKCDVCPYSTYILQCYQYHKARVNSCKPVLIATTSATSTSPAAQPIPLQQQSRKQRHW